MSVTKKEKFERERNPAAFIGYVVRRCEEDILSDSCLTKWKDTKSVAREVYFGRNIYDDLFGFYAERPGETEYRQLVEFCRQLDREDDEEEEFSSKEKLELLENIAEKIVILDKTFKDVGSYVTQRHVER